jgi:hypothetical protein
MDVGVASMSSYVVLCVGPLHRTPFGQAMLIQTPIKPDYACSVAKRNSSEHFLKVNVTLRA